MNPSLKIAVQLLDRCVVPILTIATALILWLSIVEKSPGILLLHLVATLLSFIVFGGGFWISQRDQRSAITMVYSFTIIAACLGFTYFKALNGTAYPYGWEDDDFRFDSIAEAIYKGNILDVPAIQDEIKDMTSGTWHRAYNYSIFIAYIYRGVSVLGLSPHPMYPRIVNALLLSYISALAIWITSMCGPPLWVGKLAAYLCGLSPYMVYNALHTYRDTLAGLGIILALAGIVRLSLKPAELRKRSIRSIIMSLICVMTGSLISGNLRNTYFVLIALIFTLSLTLKFVSSKTFWTLVIAVGIAGSVVMYSFGLDNFQSNDDSIEALAVYHERNAGASGGIGGRIFQMSYFPSIPGRFMLRNLTPLPFGYNLLTDNYQGIGTVLWILLIPFFLKAGAFAFKESNSERLRGLQITIIGFLVFYWVNILTTLQTRHISCYYPAASVVIAYGMALEQNRVFNKILIALILGGGVFAVYFAAKLIGF